MTPDNPLMNFCEAIEIIVKGGKVTKLEWKDRRAYCLLKEDLLQLHKAGEPNEITHPWIINSGDLEGLDWVEKNE